MRRIISGGVSNHAINRLMKNSDFRGTKGDARKLLKCCLKLSSRSAADRVIISSENLEKYSYSNRKLEELGLPDGEWFAEISYGEVENAKLLLEGLRKN